MYKILISMTLVVTFVLGAPKSNKPSDLELLLFKVGFESLLNDVQTIKNQTKINKDDILNITNKLEYILEKIESKKTLAQEKKISERTAYIAKLEERINKLEKNTKSSKTTPIKVKKSTPKINNSVDLLKPSSNVSSRFAKANENHYTISIATYSTSKGALEFTNKHLSSSEDVFMFPIKSNNKTYIKVISGIYATKTQAKQALKIMNKSLKNKNQLTIRKIKQYKKYFL